MMVDIKTNRMIDMIETRECEPVVEWLRSYPNLRVVSRDGSLVYKSAIETAHPKAAQVSDRFHLLKNLTAYAIEYLKKKIKSKITIPAGTKTTSDNDNQPIPSLTNENRKLTVAEKYDKIVELSRLGYKKTQICKKINMDLRFYEKLIAMSPAEREKFFKTNLNLSHEEKVELKMKAVNEIRGMKQAGLSKRAIKRRTGFHMKTINNYLDENFNPVHAMYGVKRAGILTPHIQKIDSMLESGMKGTDIILSVQAAGYTGSDGNVRQYISNWKKCRLQLYDKNGVTKTKTETLERKDVFRLLFHPLEKVNSISSTNYNTLCTEYPCFANIHSVVWDFRNLLKSKDALNLFCWLKKAKSLNIREINSFVAAIERDFMAVYNAIALDYSNGLAEGKVNKLKLIKRIMFGKGSFATLRNKVLLLENPFHFN